MLYTVEAVEYDGQTIRLLCSDNSIIEIGMDELMNNRGWLTRALSKQQINWLREELQNDDFVLFDENTH